VDNPKSRWGTESVGYVDGFTPDARLKVLQDQSRSIVTKNDSPDLGFDYSLNPYRGCFHGCTYCYARPTHEYLDLGAGTDFERTLLVKPEASRLLEEKFRSRSWKGDLILLSGNTDCYQPLEASHALTRQCLEVFLAYRNPVAIITKSPLVERDIDLLLELHEVTSVSVTISIPVWDLERARAVEPFVAAPARRMQTISRLAAAGLDVGINIAPVIPGLGDSDIPNLLNRAHQAGAVRASFIFLRLPGSVRETFEAGLKEKLPLRAAHVMSRVRDTMGGKTYDSRFSVRMRGQGPYAAVARAVFDTHVRRLGLNKQGLARPLNPPTFRRPDPAGQLSLF
jgi:DNA repair photolyase